MKKYVTANKNYKTQIDVDKCEFKELFDHKKVILYFSSLKKVIISNWDELGSKFNNKGIDSNRFAICMDDLNAGRTDADHYDAKDMSLDLQKWEIDDITIEKFCMAKKLLKFFKK